MTLLNITETNLLIFFIKTDYYNCVMYNVTVVTEEKIIWTTI